MATGISPVQFWLACGPSTAAFSTSKQFKDLKELRATAGPYLSYAQSRHLRVTFLFDWRNSVNHTAHSPSVLTNQRPRAGVFSASSAEFELKTLYSLTTRASSYPSALQTPPNGIGPGRAVQPQRLWSLTHRSGA